MREARRQRHKEECNVPSICLLDPDGDLADYLIYKNLATKNHCWACYHSSLYTFRQDDFEIGIVPCAVGSSYAVLVAEQLTAKDYHIICFPTSPTPWHRVILRKGKPLEVLKH